MVVGTFWDITGAHNEGPRFLMENFKWDTVDENTEVTSHIGLFFDFMGSTRFWHYSGSLTTPPCSEVVEWFVIQEAQQILPDELDQLKSFIGTANA